MKINKSMNSLIIYLLKQIKGIINLHFEFVEQKNIEFVFDFILVKKIKEFDENLMLKTLGNLF